MLNNFFNDMDQVEITDDMLNGPSSPLLGSPADQNQIKSEHMPMISQIKQEVNPSMTPTIQHSPVQTNMFKPMATSDPLISSNFNPLSNIGSSVSIMPTTLLTNKTQFAAGKQQQSTIHSVDLPLSVTPTLHPSPLTSLQLNQLDSSNVALTQAQPQILYTTTNNNNNTYVIQTSSQVPEKHQVQISSAQQSPQQSQMQFQKKIQSMPQVLTLQSIGTENKPSNTLESHTLKVKYIHTFMIKS